MATLRHINHRIRSIKNIQHITKAMKLVSVARLRRAQERLEAARPYAKKMAEVTLDLALATPWSYNPLLRPHIHSRRALMAIFTGDRGLCGSYHEKIIQHGMAFAEELRKKQEVTIYAVGRQSARILRRIGHKIEYEFTESARGVSFEIAKILAQTMLDGYRREYFDAIYLVYSKFNSVLSQKPRVFQLLPVVPALARQRAPEGLFLFEPSRKEVLDSILPRYVESEIFRAFLECEAGELGARMAAMSSASNNAEGMIGRLILDYHRARQAQVTREISEIVGGAEVLR